MTTDPRSNEELKPCCIRCGERLKGVAALTTTLCGLCADDELNARQRAEALVRVIEEGR